MLQWQESLGEKKFLPEPKRIFPKIEVKVQVRFSRDICLINFVSHTMGSYKRA